MVTKEQRRKHLEELTYQEVVEAYNYAVNYEKQRDKMVEELHAFNNINSDGDAVPRHNKVHNGNIYSYVYRCMTRWYCGKYQKTLPLINKLVENEWIQRSHKTSSRKKSGESKTFNTLNVITTASWYLEFPAASEKAFQYIKNDILFAWNDPGYRRYIRMALSAAIRSTRTNTLNQMQLDNILDVYNDNMNALRKLPAWLKKTNIERYHYATRQVTNTLRELLAQKALPQQVESIRVASFIIGAVSNIGHNDVFDIFESVHKDLDPGILKSKVTPMIAARCLKMTKNENIRALSRATIKNGKSAYHRSAKELATSVIDYIYDGIRMYFEMKQVAYDNTSRGQHTQLQIDISRKYLERSLKGKEIDVLHMSIVEMYNCSAAIHRVHHIIQCEIAAERLNDYTPMPVDDDILPELEEIRIKTVGEMIKAGIECDHCIGSYYFVYDLMFFRKDNMCAAVRRNTLRVEQCYDYHNVVTDASKEFKAYLESYLSKMIYARKEKQEASGDNQEQAISF